MVHNLQFDFLADKEKNTLTIRREFKAPRQLVWDCYTKSELLNQWFAPKPLTTKTKLMDFRAGGRWHYAMVEPGGTEHWGLTDFLTIQPIDFYTSTDAFCNAEGEINENLPQANWLVTFTDKGENTLVETIVTYPSLHDLETIINMGMEQGMAATLEKLDELLIKMTEQITVTATIHADAKKVWDYYTNPKHIVNWNFADPSWHCPNAVNDMKVGGTYRARMEAKDGSFGFDFEAVYTQIVDGAHFTYQFGDRKATITLHPADRETEISVSFDPETQNPIEMQRGGWQSILNNFKSYTEAN